MFYTYILRSLKDSRYYYGHTADLDKRLKEHNAGKVRSTKGRIPFEVHYSEIFETKSEAYRREMFFKSREGRDWLFTNRII